MGGPYERAKAVCSPSSPGGIPPMGEGAAGVTFSNCAYSGDDELLRLVGELRFGMVKLKGGLKSLPSNRASP